MRELVTMWRNTRMIVLTALIAAVYAAILIPFKAIPIVPGITELRVAQVIPPVASLLFGPAAAWGTAIGNLIGDFVGGTFGLGSVFGFIGNFLLGAVPYMLWGRLGPLSSGEEPTMKGSKQVTEFIILVIGSGIACAFMIAWGLELTGLYPFTVLGPIIAINNVLVAAILGPILQGLLYPRVKRWGLLWADVMEPGDIGTGSTGGLAAWLMLVGAVAGWALCLSLSLSGGNLIFVKEMFAQARLKGGSMNVVLAGLPFLLAMLAALFLGRARTDLTGSGRKAA
jgi:energy-coupling factor transport system substrate-specific component